MDKVKTALEKLLKPGTYGHLEIDIADGEIAVVRETVTTKYQTRRGNPRYDQASK
jgi:hypothetical protein